MATDPAQHSAPAKCRSCHGPLHTPVFCDNCRTLNPADGLNYFELLGLPPQFAIDPAELRRKYLETARRVHPDVAAGGAADDVSLRVSAQLNEAYRVLGDPVLRAEYLLELLGGKPAVEDRNVLPDVLMNTLTLRDEAAQARQSGDADTLKRCRGEGRQFFDRMLARIRDLAAGLPGDENLRRELRATLNSIKYYHKLLAEL